MKIKSRIKRFFRGWVPAEPKMANYWSRNKLGITLFLSLSIIVASIITFELWNVGAGIQTIPAALPPPTPEPEPEPEEPKSTLPPTPTPTPTPTPAPTPTSQPAEQSTPEKDYSPGVSVGDYVTYGNFKLTKTNASAGPAEYEWISSLGEVDWQRVEVIEVSGEGVTLLFTEQLKNGSLSEHSGCVHVIDDIGFALDMDGSCQFKMYYFRTIIPANLTEGDSVYPPPGGPPPYDITKTEVRTYFGVNREVNILESPVEEEMPYDYRAVYEVGGGVFDRLSGMLLEYNTIMPNGERLSYSIIETNIFSTSTSSPSSSLQENTAQNIPTDTLYVTSDSAMIAISVVAEVIFRKKRRGG